MKEILSMEELKQDFGEITLEVISHKENIRTSCVRRVSDGVVIAYSICSFSTTNDFILETELHKQIVSGQAIGKTIKDSGNFYKRTTSEFTVSETTSTLSFLFDTKRKFCMSRTIDYDVEGVPYVSIVEFYNPKFIALENGLKCR